MTDSWISCRERLPERGREVLISTNYPRYPLSGRDHYVTIGWLEFEGKGWRYVEWPADHSKCGWSPTSVTVICPGDEFVIAWMPVPEPYRGGAK